MTETCHICQDAQRRTRVDDDLRIGLEASLIATRQRVSRSAVIEHWRVCLGMAASKPSKEVEHAKNEALASLPSLTFPAIGQLAQDRLGVRFRSSADSIDDLQVTENPERQFKQAWRLAKDDARMQARMLAWLNEELRPDDMELP
jgi:hypothetical protein